MAKGRLTVAAASTVAVLAVGYPAAAWYLGAQIEKAHADVRAMIAAHPYLKVTNESYERGLFSASETTTIEIPDALFNSSGGEVEEAEGSTAKQAPPAPIRVTVKTAIQHGPLPGFSSLAAGSETSTIEFAEPLRATIAEAFGTDQPLDIRTTYDFQGGGRSTLVVLPFKLALPGDTPESKAMFSGERAEMVMEFSKGLADYTLRGTAPGFTIAEPDGLNMTMQGMAFDSQVKRIFADEPLFYSGSQKLTVAEVNVTPGAAEQTGARQKLVFKDIAYDVQMPVAGDFMDVVAKIGADAVQVGEQNYGPAHYDFSLKHLHARKLITLSRGFAALYAKPEVFADRNLLLQALAPLQAPLFDLLTDGPAFSIDRLAFHTADGEASFNASVKLIDPKPDDFSNPLMLLAKLDAGASIALPNSLVNSLIGNGDSEEETQSARQRAADTLAQFKQQGYITLEDNRLKSSVAFKNGELQVNGKPFNPMAAMLQQQAEAQKTGIVEENAEEAVAQE
ncbi:MAG: YdgA family protein [Propionivibrio sp.]